MKRLIDLATSILALFCLSPMLVFIGIAVRWDSPGPSLFYQERIGRFYVPFTIVKFRTMADAKPSDQSLQVTISGDSRVTKLGRLLRRSKLDELPQLWNVLWGDMSLVGPRPEVERYVAIYTEGQRRVLDFRPGLTCQSSLTMYDEEIQLAQASDPVLYYENVVMPAKIRAALQYADNSTVWSDLGVIFQTAKKMLPLMRSTA